MAEITEPSTAPHDSVSGAANGHSSRRTGFEWLLFVWSHRRGTLRTALVAGVLAAIVAFLVPNYYEATARLMPPDQGNNGMMLLSMLSAKVGDNFGSMAGDMLNLKNSGAVVSGVVRSRTVADSLINRFDLRKVYWIKRYEDARKKLTHRTDVAEDRKSGIITITVTDSDPQRAAALAQAYVDETNRLVANLTTSSAHRERVFLEGRLEGVKQELDTAALDVSRFASRNGTLDPQMQGKAMLEAAATLQGQMIAAETELRGLQQVYGPENVRVRSAAARVGELRRNLEKLTGQKAPDTPATDAQGEQTYPSIRQLPLVGNSYYNLYRRAKILEAVFETLTKQYEAAKVQEAKEIPTIKLLDQPQVPEKKSWPPRLVIIALAVLLAVAGRTLYFVARELVSRMETSDPRRVLAAEIAETFAARARPRFARFHAPAFGSQEGD